jgi:hypothetical protein
VNPQADWNYPQPFPILVYTLCIATTGVMMHANVQHPADGFGYSHIPQVVQQQLAAQAAQQVRREQQHFCTSTATLD